MVSGVTLKFLGDLFYMTLAGCVLYAAWGLLRDQRRINAAAIKAHITAYELQKMVQGRSR